MIEEKEDWFYKGKLAHWDFDLLNNEVKQVLASSVNLDTDKFVGKILEYIEGIR